MNTLHQFCQKSLRNGITRTLISIRRAFKMQNDQQNNKNQNNNQSQQSKNQNKNQTQQTKNQNKNER